MQVAPEFSNEYKKANYMEQVPLNEESVFSGTTSVPFICHESYYTNAFSLQFFCLWLVL